jgi:MFS family permease
LVIGGWGALWLLASTHMSKYAVFQGMQAILLPTQVAGVSSGDKVVGFGAVATLGALAAAIANPIAGRWSDRTHSRWGKRTPWLVGTSILALLALLLLAGMPSVIAIGAGYFFVMAVMGTFEATLAAVMPDRVQPARMGLASSMIGGAGSIGILIGVNVAARLVGTLWLAYGVLGLAMVLLTLVFVILRPDPSRRSGPGILRHEDEDAGEVAGTDPGVDAGVDSAALPNPDGSHSGFFSALKDRDFMWAFVARALLMVGFFTASTYLLYTLMDYVGTDKIPGQDPATANATLVSITMISALASMVISGPLSDKTGRRKVFVIGSSMGIAVAALIPLFFPTWTGMVVYAAVGGVFYGCYSAVDQAIMATVLPSSQDHARDPGLLQIASTGPQVTGPVVAAAMISLFGGYGSLFVFCAVAAIIAGVAILPIRKVR